MKHPPLNQLSQGEKVREKVCERELITFDCAASDSVQQERAPAQSQEMLIAGGGATRCRLRSRKFREQAALKRFEVFFTNNGSPSPLPPSKCCEDDGN